MSWKVEVMIKKKKSMFFCLFLFPNLFYVPAQLVGRFTLSDHGQAVVTGVVPSPPRYVPSIFYRV